MHDASQPSALRPLVEVDDLTKLFGARGGLSQILGAASQRKLIAVDAVSFQINAGEILGLVGESGSGKTTLGRCLLRLVEPSSGQVRFDGRDLIGLSKGDLRVARRQMQMISFSTTAPLAHCTTMRMVVAQRRPCSLRCCRLVWL